MKREEKDVIEVTRLLHRWSNDYHLRLPGSLKPIEAQVLLSIAANVSAKCISRARALSWWGDNDPRDEICLASGLPEHLITEQWALVEEAHEISEGADVVGKVALATWEDYEER